jgi:hypothetical protein
MKKQKKGGRRTINQISLSGNSPSSMKEYNYEYPSEVVPGWDSKISNSVEAEEEIIRRRFDKPSQVKLDKKALSIPGLVSSSGSFVNFTGNIHPVNISEIKSDSQGTKKVFMRGNIPKEIKRQNYEKIIDRINQAFLLKWQDITELKDKDIDINLTFETDPESSDAEVVYTIYVSDLDTNEIETVWNELRKLFNQITNTLKHNLPRYRKKVENLEQMAVIHIEW